MTGKIKILGRNGIVISSKPEKKLLTLLKEFEVPILSDCGGKGICGKCTLTIKPKDELSKISVAEKKCLSNKEIEAGKRLACQTKFSGKGDIVLSQINIINENINSSKINIEHSFTVDSQIQRIIINKNSMEYESFLTTNDLSSWLISEARSEKMDFSFNALKQLSTISNLGNDITFVKNDRHIFSVISGAHSLSLGLAIDLGTTTIGAYLCDLKTGKILSSSAKTNPQRIYGEDIISRIDFATKNKTNLEEIHTNVLAAIDELISQNIKINGFHLDDIDDACLVGNPTMQALFLGFCPKSLGRSPYYPVTKKAINIKSHELGLMLKNDVNFYLLPTPSAFIGGDALATAIAIEKPKNDESILIIDLGTNGEILLLTNHGSFATSAATGPAFEGYTMSCGVRAIPGAVNEITWDRETNQFDYRVIPGHPENKIIGLCGSGLIDAVAAAIEANFISHNGRVKDNMMNIHGDMEERIVHLVSAKECNLDKDLKLTQTDVRQLQLGKAALRVGIDSLLEMANCNQVTKTILTGAFGSSFHWENAIKIGMLPPKKQLGEIETINNAAGLGAVRALVNQQSRHRAERLAQNLQCLALEKRTDFSQKFAEASFFSP